MEPHGRNREQACPPQDHLHLQAHGHLPAVRCGRCGSQGQQIYRCRRRGGEETIKRKRPYVSASDTSKRRMASSVYVKGFGDEEPSTQFDIEAFFSRFGEVNSVRLRRTPERLFKGSVFVEFNDEESAKKFLALDPAPKWKDHDLKIMSKEAYVAEKNEQIKNGDLVPNSTRASFYEESTKRNGRGGRGRGSGRGDIDANDWKKRRDNDRKNGFKDHRGGRGGRGRGRGGNGRGGRDRNNENRAQAGNDEYVICFPFLPFHPHPYCP